MKLVAAAVQTPAETLARVRHDAVLLQDARPLTSSLEWELSALHWRSAGVNPFLEEEVPYLINNSGRLSEHAAALLFANLRETADSGQKIHLLELGAGTGLFARFFVDTFRAICRQESCNFHERLVYHVTDASPRTVEQWREREQFADYPEIAATCRDALAPANPGDPAFRAVFCNYILDVLPATVVKRSSGGMPEELLIRTLLTQDMALLAQYTSWTPLEIEEIAKSNDPNLRARLSPLLSLFEIESHFGPVQSPVDPQLLGEALDLAAAGERSVLNYGAIGALRNCLEHLDPEGFILINDYGPVKSEQVAGHSYGQRFGLTSALGVNFPLLERHFRSLHHTVLAPQDDESRALHTRLILPNPSPATVAAFENRFGPAGSAFLDGPANEGRQHLAAGRKNEALECFQLALSRSPRDWQLVGEIAEFVGLQLQDLTSGLELIRAAIEQNPWYSPWLWNILGDILFLKKELPGAHEAYLQAQRLNPNDTRTNLNLAFTYSESGEYSKALQAIAIALESDLQGRYRSRLLEKQQQTLNAISARSLGEAERLAQQTMRLRSPA